VTKIGNGVRIHVSDHNPPAPPLWQPPISPSFLEKSSNLSVLACLNSRSDVELAGGWGDDGKEMIDSRVIYHKHVFHGNSIWVEGIKSCQFEDCTIQSGK
jgi:hypothetical protein